jgi:succinate-semialdehyde dehydrogenase/glutarate-semialdehyde dehydrogenase
MNVINPASGETLRTVDAHDPAEVERRLAAAASAFHRWRDTSFAQRSRLLNRVARLLRAGRDGHARLMTEEMGKPIGQSEAEVDKCAWACEHFAAHAERYLAAETIETDARRSVVTFEPLGPVLAVMPWNFPFWQVVRAATPALMAGNVVVLKHASNVPGCALALERLFAEAGLPPGVFTTLLVDGPTAEGLVEHPVIRAVTLTGSETAGMKLAARAGSALKKIVLELGGSDPFIVLADADLERVVPLAVTARIQNNGQSCIAAKRFIVEAPALERFSALFADRMAALRVGDPLERTTEVGPLARGDLVDELERQVADSVARGARVVTGGRRLAGRGFFYAPTVLERVVPGMPAFDQETFGPVAAMVAARDRMEAVALANRSSFGLGASVWTEDVAAGEALAGELEAGAVFVNAIVKSDPRLPFGGVKRSGHGRELGEPGIREFVNLKTVWIG